MEEAGGSGYEIGAVLTCHSPSLAMNFIRRKAEVGHDCSHASSMLCGGNSGKELRFGGAVSSDRLCLASVGDGAATQKEGVACSRSAITQIIGVCGIKECNWLLGIHSGKFR